MSADNGTHPELGEKEPTLKIKEAMTYRSTIANPAPAYVFLLGFFPFRSNLRTYHVSLLVVVYSPSQPPHSCYLYLTLIRVEFRRQMLLLVWLFSRVVSCNSLQACGSSLEATYSELQVSFRTKKKKSIIDCLFILNFLTLTSSHHSFLCLRYILDVLCRYIHPRIRSPSCLR